MATGDRNYDIAKETTSQEILNNLSSGNSLKLARDITTTTTSNYTITPVDITGKGKLCFAAFLQGIPHHDGYGEVKITVDGEVKFWVKITNNSTSSNPTNEIYLFDYRYLLSHSDGKQYLMGSDAGMLLEVVPTGYLELSNELQDLGNVSSTSQYQIPLNGSIPFNSSLKVELSSFDVGAIGNTRKEYYDIGYVLYE